MRSGTTGRGVRGGGVNAYEEVAEVDEGPRRAGGAAEERESEDPGDEEDEYVGGPHAGISEPFRVLVDIRRRRRLHVHLPHFRPSPLNQADKINQQKRVHRLV